MSDQKAAALAALNAVLAVGEAIKDLGEVPNGKLYAFLSGRLSFESYTSIIGILKNAGAIKEENNVLFWIGKEIPMRQS